MACNRMMALERICVFFFILSVTLANCSIYPPSVEEGCILQCVDYLILEESQYDVSLEVLKSRCRDGGVPDFHCETSYDEHQASDDPERLDCVST